MSLRVLELFGGIGACTKALKNLNVDFNVVDYVEIDKYAVASYNAINDTNFITQDIREWNKDIEVDLIMHGSPCQDFSTAGKNAGGDEGSGTRSSLMYETVRIIEKLKPKYIIWENVKNILSKRHIHNFNNYIDKLNNLGYTSYYKVLNSKNYGVPQNRERVFTISIRNDIEKEYIFPEEEELKIKLKDLLEEEVDSKYYLSEQAIKGRLATSYNKYKLENNIINNQDIHPTILARYEGAPSLYIKNNTKKGYLEAKEGDSVDISHTIATSDNLGVVIGTYQFSKSDNFMQGKNRLKLGKEISDTLYTTQKEGIVYNDLKIRRLTPKEVWRLMSFDDEDFNKASKVNSNTQLYKQAGNSIVVKVLEKILKNLL